MSVDRRLSELKNPLTEFGPLSLAVQLFEVNKRSTDGWVARVGGVLGVSMLKFLQTKRAGQHILFVVYIIYELGFY